tara:strand:- start:517 stop:1626 length:1110 start_codon:yes stop_codon:yes gene_type:complete
MIIKTLNLLLFLVTAVFMFHKAEKEHYYNWDSIPYSMGVHVYEGKTMNEAHYRAFSNLKEEVSPGLFQNLCCSGDYRFAQYQSAENLNSMLPMYTSKPGYISLISLIKNTFGVSEYVAMKYISIFAVLFLSILFFISFFNANGLGKFAWIPLIFLGDMFFLSKLMTPDAITTLIFAVGLVFLIRNKSLIGYIVIASSMLFRLDMIVAVGLLGLIPAIEKKYIYAALNSIVFLAIYFIISSGSEHIGWWPHFYTSVVSQQTNLTDFNPTFDLEKYISIVFGNLEWIFGDTNYIKWFGMNILLLLMGTYLYQSKQNTHLNLVLIVLCVSIIIKFMLFPKVDSRIYLSILTPALFIALMNLKRPSKNRVFNF